MPRTGRSWWTPCCTWKRSSPPPPPVPEDDPEGYAAWITPEGLLDRADAAWTQAGSAQDHPRILIRRASMALDAGDAVRAEELLDRALAQADTFGLDDRERSLGAVMRAQAGAVGGLSVADIASQIDRAVRETPFDVEVVARAAQALQAVGEPDRALSFALTAAWLAHDDPERWSEVMGDALLAADLPVAHFAARRASDLAPDDADLGRKLHLTATLMHDREAATLGYARAGEDMPARWPPGVEELMAHAPPEGLLAVLDYHDQAVIGSPLLLGLRAQLRIDAGHFDGAARDALLLDQRFDNDDGVALGFAAQVGRVWSASLPSRLDAAAARAPLVRMTRMEHRLASGGDPTIDARALGDDPRAQIVNEAAVRPAEVAAALEGWPADLTNARVSAPPGLRTHVLLSKIDGVSAFSDPERAITVLVVNGITGVLPPPLGNLYTPVMPPVESLPSGGQVLRLTGGIIPLYAAFAIHEGKEVIGLGHTVGGAQQAVELVTGGL